MFNALRFLVSMMALIGMARFPNEQGIIARIGASILLLLYEAEDIIKIVKDMIKEIRG